MRLFGSVSTLYTCVICCEPRVFAGSRELKVRVFGGGWKGAVPAGGIAVLFIRTAGPSGSGRVALDAASIRLTARCGATERRWTVLERQGKQDIFGRPGGGPGGGLGAGPRWSAWTGPSLIWPHGCGALAVVWAPHPWATILPAGCKPGSTVTPRGANQVVNLRHFLW